MVFCHVFLFIVYIQGVLYKTTDFHLNGRFLITFQDENLNTNIEATIVFEWKAIIFLEWS